MELVAQILKVANAFDIPFTKINDSDGMVKKLKRVSLKWKGL